MIHPHLAQKRPGGLKLPKGAGVGDLGAITTCFGAALGAGAGAAGMGITLLGLFFLPQHGIEKLLICS